MYTVAAVPLQPRRASVVTKLGVEHDPDLCLEFTRVIGD